MKSFEIKERQLGEYVFYVRPLPAFTAANISGELFSIILPALGSVAPIVGGKGSAESLLDMDSEVAASALAKGMGVISGDKLERLLKMLIVQNRNISFEPLETKGSQTVKPQLLTEDLANDMFCGDVQDMFVLAFDVIKSNYSGFFEKLGNLFGDRVDALLTLIKKAEPGLKNTAT